MKYIYNLSYSCYQTRLKILLNGKESISKSSTILQYMNEPLYRWADKIFDLLFKEIEEDYEVVFTGRKEEAEILINQAAEYGHCSSFKLSEPQINTSLQQRMIGLSRLIKENKLGAIKPVLINAAFIGSKESLNRWKAKIDMLEIKNQYCNTIFRSCVFEKESELDEDCIRFYIFSKPEEEAEYLEKIHNDKYSFMLLSGIKSGFFGLKENNYIYGINDDSFFDVVFNCFFLFPLAECFSDYAKRILRQTQNQKVINDIKILLSEKPVARISVDEKIEINCSNPFNIKMLPESSRVPEFTFEYQLPGIVECSQQRVYGKKKGITKVKIYEKGETEPIRDIEFTVYERNRISNITLSDYALSLGAGDNYKIEMSYSPNNADNIRKIQWYSDNCDIAEVDSVGFVNVKSEGKCRIYCAAEKVSVYCSIEAKPYLKDIILPSDLETGKISMEKGESRTIEIRTEPLNALDKSINIISSNMLVVNIINNTTIIANEEGEAQIIIENSTQRIKKNFIVVVNDNKKTAAKKKRFFGLFG